MPEINNLEQFEQLFAEITQQVTNCFSSDAALAHNAFIEALHYNLYQEKIVRRYQSRLQQLGGIGNVTNSLMLFILYQELVTKISSENYPQEDNDLIVIKERIKLLFGQLNQPASRILNSAVASATAPQPPTRAVNARNLAGSTEWEVQLNAIVIKYGKLLGFTSLQQNNIAVSNVSGLLKLLVALILQHLLKRPLY